MRKLNQRGFSLVEGMLLFIALVLVTFVGYYVYNTQKDDDKPLATKTSQEKSSAAISDKKVTTAKPTDANLQAYLIKNCGSENGAAINEMFANKASQNVSTDNYQRQDGYAVVNTRCDLQPEDSHLQTEFLKFSDSQWKIVVRQPTSVSCAFLADQGFPDKLKGKNCANPGDLMD